MSPDDPKPRVSRRKQLRYAVSDDCRLRASILLRSSDPATANKEWAGTLVNISPAGAHIQISLGAVAYTGDSCVLKLSHGGIKVELRGNLIHYVCSARYSVCGMKYDDSFGGLDKTYDLFLKTIAASSELVAGQAGNESTRRHREEYTGADGAKLVVWREEAGAGATILGFEYQISRYTAFLKEVGPDMFKNKEGVRFKSATGPDTPLAKPQELDARWEFSLAASNLPKNIAPDIRRLLRLVS